MRVLVSRAAALVLAFAAAGCGRLNYESSRRDSAHGDATVGPGDASSAFDAQRPADGSVGCTDTRVTTVEGPLLDVAGSTSGLVVLHGAGPDATHLDTRARVVGRLVRGGPARVEQLRAAATSTMLGLLWRTPDYTGWMQVFLTRFDPTGGEALEEHALTGTGLHAFPIFVAARDDEFALVYEGDVPTAGAYVWEATVVGPDGGVRHRRTWDRNMIGAPDQIVGTTGGYLAIARETHAVYELSADLTAFTIGDEAPHGSLLVQGTPSAPAIVVSSASAIDVVPIASGGRLGAPQAAVVGARYDAASAFGPPGRRSIAWRDGNSLRVARLDANRVPRLLSDRAAGPLAMVPGADGPLVVAGQDDGSVSVYRICD